MANGALKYLTRCARIFVAKRSRLFCFGFQSSAFARFSHPILYLRGVPASSILTFAQSVCFERLEGGNLHFSMPLLTKPVIEMFLHDVQLYVVLGVLYG